MKVDIDFTDEKLNKIIKAIIKNYKRFNFCSMSVITDDLAEFETDPENCNQIPDYDQEVTIKLKFSY